MESWLLENLGLLVGIDLLRCYEVVEGFARVLGEDVVDSGGIALEEVCQ